MHANASNLYTHIIFLLFFTSFHMKGARSPENCHGCAVLRGFLRTDRDCVKSGSQVVHVFDQACIVGAGGGGASGGAGSSPRRFETSAKKSRAWVDTRTESVFGPYSFKLPW